jgi:hypothetical protein
MPTWQITIATSALMFIAGALIIISSEHKKSLLEGYGAWLMALLILALEFHADPKAFVPVIEFFDGVRDLIAEPPIAVAVLCWLILTANAVVALLDKNARLFGKPQPLADIRLGMPEPKVNRSPMRRLMDVLMFRTPPRPHAQETPSAEVEPSSNSKSAWMAMLKSERIRDAFSITPEEQQMLSRVSFLGEVQSPHDLRLVLDVLRTARGSLLKEAASEARAESPSTAEEFPARVGKPTH